ncbi:UNVERIFIED_CONTAM: hypothetical protein Sangu_1314900 [Sesamum angustifolium]|uniref:Uncharacterized protein n=1 Tax=Sesamum angustifolium TaxID=2727405 RepID=A0AAW2NMY8_9LAMI
MAKIFMQDYFEAPSVPQVLEESTLAGHVKVSLMMVRGLALWMSVLVHTFTAAVARTIMMSQVGKPFFECSACCRPTLWNGCNQSQLGVFAELVDIKADGHISEPIYDRMSQWADRILPFDHTLPGGYYSTKKLVKDLGLPVEKIHPGKNDCMLYWKDDVDLEYCNSVGTVGANLLEGETHTGRSPRILSLDTCR